MISVDIAIKSKKWLVEQNIANFIRKTCQKLITLTDLHKFSQKLSTCELSISLVSDAQMKKINFKYRNQNKSTNVLSFPTLDKNEIHKFGLKKAILSHKCLFLGDIIISYETTKKESLAQKKEICDHISHLILHSLLHLIGFDHENENDAKIMENLEIKILKKIGINNPYVGL